VANSVQQTTDGGYIVVGTTSSYGAGAGDIYLIKTDAGGETLWTRTFGGTADDNGMSVQQTDDSGFVIVGSTSSFGGGGRSVYVLKTDASGDTLWTWTSGGAWDEGNHVQQTADSGYVVTGSKYSFSTNSTDLFLIRIGAGGDTLWTRTFGRSGTDNGNCVRQTGDGGYVVAGTTTSFGAGEGDFYLVKTNANGEALWTGMYGGPKDEQCASVVQTADGGYVLAGSTVSYGGGLRHDVWLVKTDTNGGLLWSRDFGNWDDDLAYSVQQTRDNGYAVAGVTYGLGAHPIDMYLVKTDSLGNVAASVAEPKPGSAPTAALSVTCEPNPFRSRTAISLQLAANNIARLAIFDASGRCVRAFTVNRTPYAFWDGTDELGQPLSAGAYFIRCEAAGEHATTRIILQR